MMRCARSKSLRRGDKGGAKFSGILLPAILLAVVTLGLSLAPVRFGLAGSPDGSGDSVELITRGSELFARRCAICHGNDLEGKSYEIGSGDRRRIARVPSLRKARWFWLDLEIAVANIVKYGESEHPLPSSEFKMPAFGVVLSDDDIRAIVAYLKSIWDSNAGTGAAAPDVPPKPETP